VVQLWAVQLSKPHDKALRLLPPPSPLLLLLLLLLLLQVSWDGRHIQVLPFPKMSHTTQPQSCCCCRSHGMIGTSKYCRFLN
jgi:hypothetical protein